MQSSDMHSFNLTLLIRHVVLESIYDTIAPNWNYLLIIFATTAINRHRDCDVLCAARHVAFAWLGCIWCTWPKALGHLNIQDSLTLAVWESVAIIELIIAVAMCAARSMQHGQLQPATRLVLKCLCDFGLKRLTGWLAAWLAGWPGELEES